MATADQQFCLRWNNHQSTLISVFDTLLENGTLVDCTLAAEGQSLKAHKVVLSACSPYLEALLSQHYEKHPIVIMKDVKFSELKSMMDYMYRGEVNISQDQLGTFLKAAESLQIKGLSDNGDDARDVGSTASKRQDASRPSVTQTRAPVESKRPASTVDSDASRDGSISPSSLRKRRRTRRPSHGDDPDSHLDANACDLPNAQSTPMPVSVPNTSIVPTSIQNLPKQIVKQEPTSISTLPETGLKKEIMDPPTEPLLEPKTEYLDYMNNENSIEVEDLTLDDDDELDSSMDASRPGPSHGDMSNQGYPAWPMTDQSGTDEIFMAAQEAVGAATAQRDSQGQFRFDELYSQFFQSGGHGQKSEFRCECGKVYPRYTSLWNHKRYRCGKQPQFTCEFCDHRTWHKCNLKSHMAAKHSDKMRQGVASHKMEAFRAKLSAVLGTASVFPQNTLNTPNFSNCEHYPSTNTSSSTPLKFQFSSSTIPSSQSLSSSIPSLQNSKTSPSILSSLSQNLESSLAILQTSSSNVLPSQSVQTSSGTSSNPSLISCTSSNHSQLLSTTTKPSTYSTNKSDQEPKFTSPTTSSDQSYSSTANPCSLPSNIPPLPPGLTISFEKPASTSVITLPSTPNFTVSSSVSNFQIDSLNELPFCATSENSSQESNDLFSSLV